jgi:hypothetical protein
MVKGQQNPPGVAGASSCADVVPQPYFPRSV